MMTKKVSYNFPTKIRFGCGVIDELGEHLVNMKQTAPLVVIDSDLEKLPFFEAILEDLKKHRLSFSLFDTFYKNPIEADVEEGVRAFQNSQSDSIIGIGGGASLDVSRAIALKANHHEPLFHYLDENKITGKIPYFVTVPTASGTGSEVGRSALIADDHTREKKILFSPRLMAKAVFADPNLTLTLPPYITATTGLDALTHNVEAYCAKGFDPMCDGIALEGIRLIWENLEIAACSPTIEARSAMLMASLMGAVAFQKGLGVVHSLAHPLSTVCDMHHGLANAVLLPYGVRFNKSAIPERIARIENLIGETDFTKALFRLNNKLLVPTTLTEVGVDEELIPKLSELAEKDSCHLSNPRACSRKDLEGLYREAL